jgi:hypothetical protein
MEWWSDEARPDKLLKQLEVIPIGPPTWLKPVVNENYLASGEAGDGFGAGADVKFLVDVAYMGVNGADADAELIGDFFGAPTLGEESQDFFFARGEISFFADSDCGLAKCGDNFAGDVAGHGRAAAMYFGDSFENFLGRDVFNEVTGSAGFHRFENFLTVFFDGEHDDLGFPQDFAKGGDARDAILAGQINIHENNIGGEARQSEKRFFSAFAGGDAGETGRFAD